MNHRLIRRIAVLVSIVGAALSVGWVADYQTGSRIIVGEVVNGTPGAAVPEDLVVTLHRFSQMEETNTYTTTVAAEGSFRFEAIPLEEGDTVVSRALYDGVTYVSEFATVDETGEQISLPVTIYETTEDASDVSVSQLHVFVDQVGDRAQIGAYVIVGNAGTRTYVGSAPSSSGGGTSARRTWSMTLPEDAENLQFEGAALGGRFVSLDDGFADQRPIPPGAGGVETSFTYELPFEEGLQVEQSFDLPVQAAVLVLPAGDWALEGPTLSKEDTLDTQMGQALSYSAGPLDAGQSLAFTVVPRTGAGGSSSDPSDRSPDEHLLVGLAAIVAAALGVAFIWRTEAPGPIPESVLPQVEAIAALDRDFESGRLQEETYRQERRTLKEEVRATLARDAGD